MVMADISYYFTYKNKNRRSYAFFDFTCTKLMNILDKNLVHFGYLFHNMELFPSMMLNYEKRHLLILRRVTKYNYIKP